MHDTIGTRPRRTAGRAGLLFALVLALALGGCSAGGDGTAELTTADGDTETTSDGFVDPETTTTTAAASTTAPTTTTPPPTAPPTTVARPPTTARPATTVPPAPATTARPLPPPTTAAPAPPPPPTTAPKPPPSSSSSGQCHASYQGTCIPPDVSDADCAGGSGNGPWYVQEKNVSVVGPDVFDLDRDGDGVGCES